MGLASSLVGWIAPNSKAAMDKARAAAQATLDPNSDLARSGDIGIGTPGSDAYMANQKAAQLGANDLTANFAPMDTSAGNLRTLAGVYGAQFRDGGLAERAATGRATSSVADAGGGGQEGVAGLRQASQGLSMQAGQVGNAERTAAGNAANENTLMAGMMDVRKAAYQAALTHANMEKNIQSKQVGLDLQNTQVGNDQRLRQAQIQGQATMQGINQDVKNAQTNLGFQVVNAGLQAGAGATAIGVDYSHRTPVDTSVSADALEIGRLAAYGRQGIEAPKSAVDVYKDSAHEQLLANQVLLNSLSRSAVQYPGMPTGATDYLNNKTSYPIAASLGR